MMRDPDRTCQRGWTRCQDDAITHMAFVGEVTYDMMSCPFRRSSPRLRGAAIDRRILANDAAFADLHRRRLALELEVLRISSDHGAHADA